MALREPREFRLARTPAYGIVAIFFVSAPPAALLWSFGQINLAALYLAATMLYVVSYELMHLTWHLPADSRIGSLRLLRILRQHHAAHHHPRLMQRSQFHGTGPPVGLVRRPNRPAPHASSGRAGARP